MWLKAGRKYKLIMPVVAINVRMIRRPRASRPSSLRPGTRSPVSRTRRALVSSSRFGHGSYGFGKLMSRPRLLFPEVGRLEFETSDWLAHLLDMHVVNITGKVVDCSNPLKGTGDPIILSLSVYLTPQAFEEIKRPLAADKKAADKKVAFGETKETDQEKKMGKRKDGLARLFSESLLLCGCGPRSHES
jgi:hypothetical protein